jgi:hypothetical protein
MVPYLLKNIKTLRKDMSNYTGLLDKNLKDARERVKNYKSVFYGYSI